VEATYQADGWYVPRLLAEVRTTPDLYFDSVSRVQLPRWSSGRVVVVGDAASCVSLLGDGSTLAMIGAYTLATALAEHHGAHGLAFGKYEMRHRRLAEPRQRLMRLAAWLLVPKTRTAIAVRNAALRLVPVLTASEWERRRATRLRLSRSARTAGASHSNPGHPNHPWCNGPKSAALCCRSGAFFNTGWRVFCC
jgi:2-polyprenyl-6-methoxyphenol hydroxylase-like FAD-dependent oxidoreductase